MQEERNRSDLRSPDPLRSRRDNHYIYKSLVLLGRGAEAVKQTGDRNTKCFIILNMLTVPRWEFLLGCETDLGNVSCNHISFYIPHRYTQIFVWLYEQFYR